MEIVVKGAVMIERKKGVTYGSNFEEYY